jgi:hypothetical protein
MRLDTVLSRLLCIQSDTAPRSLRRQRKDKAKGCGREDTYRSTGKYNRGPRSRKDSLHNRVLNFEIAVHS